MKTKVSVLVPTVGARRAELIRLFGSLVNQGSVPIEIIVIVQDNFEATKELCDAYSDKLNIIFVATKIKGLSRARNLGLRYSTGDIVVLSDDDCWYEANALYRIAEYFEQSKEIDILLTQIYDPISKQPYKSYPSERLTITNAIDLLSKSSIEIAFRRNEPVIEFDELFGLGGKYIAGEENDFLIRSLRSRKTIYYEPFVTVFHEKKIQKESNRQLIAKGAFYSKNFGFIISNLVLLRDLLFKHQNNYRWFWNGYIDYKKQN